MGRKPNTPQKMRAMLGRKPDRTPQEEERLAWLKQEMADRLLALPPEAVYEEG